MNTQTIRNPRSEGKVKENGTDNTVQATNIPASRNLPVNSLKDETREMAIARTAIRPIVQAALTLTDYDRGMFGELSLAALVMNLDSQVQAVNTGDMKNGEALLTAQALTLDAIFNTLARRAAANMGEYIGAAETYLRVALRAQSQARATVETLALLKNPSPVAFVRQANIAHGPQQVNNGPTAPPADDPRARENETRQNKLLERTNGERLDTATATATGAANSPVETVGTLDGAADGARKS